MRRSEQVDGFLRQLDPGPRRLAAELREAILTAAPNAIEEFKWSRPCYCLARPFCSFLVCKAHISLSFDEGSQLDDPHGLLQGTGKFMRHARLPLAGGVERPVIELIALAASRAT